MDIKLTSNINIMQTKLSRDRADYDRRFGAHFEFMHKLEGGIDMTEGYVNTLA